MKTFLTLGVLALALSGAGGCGSSADLVLAPSATPTPAVALINVDGSWVGTYSSNDPVDCVQGAPARASFKQIGSKVTGTLNAESTCGPTNATLEATVTGAEFKGTITNDGSGRRGDTVTGSLNNGTLLVSMQPPAPNVFSDSLILHR
jgi:hypothetical protein